MGLWGFFQLQKSFFVFQPRIYLWEEAEKNAILKAGHMGVQWAHRKDAQLAWKQMILFQSWVIPGEALPVHDASGSWQEQKLHNFP